MNDSITLTQGVFLCCLFVFGPAFGFVAVYRHIASRIGGLWSFLFASFSSYTGWFVSGIAALLVYPEYGSFYGPSEYVAILFAIPGFVTGWFGLLVLQKYADRPRIDKAGERTGPVQSVNAASLHKEPRP